MSISSAPCPTSQLASNLWACALSLCLAGSFTQTPLSSQAGVTSSHKISSTAGGFLGVLQDGDNFGSSVTLVGDIDGDGVGDLVVGARGDDDGGSLRGAVWILFLNSDLTVRAHQKISSTQGGFTGPLADLAFFGSSVTDLGDIDGNGVPDIAVGAPGLSIFNPNAAVWILFLNSNGTVKGQVEIGASKGGFGGVLQVGDQFGSALTRLNDLDGDGLPELAVGAPGDVSAPGSGQGAVWILFLAPTGAVKMEQKIDDSNGGFTGTLTGLDQFGGSLSPLGDLNGDLVDELLVGAPQSPLGATGSVWILYMQATGMVIGQTEISQATGGFGGGGPGFGLFGRSLAPLGDFDGNGVPDLAVGSLVDDVWLLDLASGGSVLSEILINDALYGLMTEFGGALAPIGDWDANGTQDLLAGAPEDDDGGTDRGAVWVLLLSGGDCNANGIPDDQDILLGFSADCNLNGIPDECDLAAGTDQDCNLNGVPDSCDIAFGQSLDCNLNAIPDECEQDCNANGVPDDCDILLGTSLDCNGNGTPDECEQDCNLNGVPDDCDLMSGTSLDCNLNGIPDECDIAAGTSADCNLNGIPDECEPDCNANGVPDDCDLMSSTSLDCNLNGIPDECDIAAGTSADCNLNGIPDECEPDCNLNGVPDDCDLMSGTSLDCNLNGIPDECDIGGGFSLDQNSNGIPDECELPSVLVYGSGVNPPGSMTVLSGSPAVGSALVVGLDNPLGTQAVGSLPLVFVSLQPDPFFPAGTPLPGFGMGGVGELLISIAPQNLTASFNGQPWSGVGIPAPVSIPIPADGTLIGLPLFAQGLLLDPSVAFGVRFGLTDAVAMVIGT